MKKLFAIMLTLVFVMCLTGCGESTGVEVKEPSNVSVGGNTEETPKSEPTEEPQSKPTEELEKMEASIAETVLVDEAGVKITAKRLAMDELFGPEIKLFIENNSGKNLTFQCHNTSINGYMVENIMSVDVVNGKKANDSLTFLDSDLMLCGIEEIADIELSFYIFGTDDWETYLETDPIQLKTSIADTYVYRYDDSGDVAYEGNSVKIVVKGLAEDESIFGPSIVVYIENTGDKDITVQNRDVSINGFMIDPVFSCDIVAGKRAVSAITFFESDLDENEIAAIENVELSFHVFDMADWETIVDTEVVTIDF